MAQSRSRSRRSGGPHGHVEGEDEAVGFGADPVLVCVHGVPVVGSQTRSERRVDAEVPRSRLPDAGAVRRRRAVQPDDMRRVQCGRQWMREREAFACELGSADDVVRARLRLSRLEDRGCIEAAGVTSEIGRVRRCRGAIRGLCVPVRCTSRRRRMISRSPLTDASRGASVFTSASSRAAVERGGDRGCRRQNPDSPPYRTVPAAFPARRDTSGSIPSKKPAVSSGFRKADDGTRTHDLLHGKQTL
jgi:hypothetical protein